MYAVLYTSAATLEQLLKQGADPNKRNDGNATALMWAASDLEKTSLLVRHGADVNARSDELRTALMIAAGRSHGAPIVKLLLDHGANPNPNANPGAESSPLLEAATAADPDSMELLMAHGADIKSVAEPAITVAVTMLCSRCVELLMAKEIDKATYTATLADIAVLGDTKAVRLMLDHGADVNAFDPTGRTPLMYASGSDLIPLDTVKLLIERGADVNASNRHQRAGDTGLTVLDIAKFRGNTPIVDLLVKSGAKGTEIPQPALKPRHENTIAGAIAGSIPVIQAADAGFTPKSGCISCHNNSMAAFAIGAARNRGFAVNEQIAAQQVKANIAFLEKMRDRLHQGFLVTTQDFFGPGMLGYVLVGLAAEKYKADLNTDTVAMYIRMHQRPDGHWAEAMADTRPPLGYQFIGQTALAMHALQIYAPKTDKPAYDKSIQMAAAWLAEARSNSNDDRAWRVLGLAWAGNRKDAMQNAMRELLNGQRADGGWSDLPSMESTAYATGKALVALQAAGLDVTGEAYQHGIRYVLKTQNEDGSWYVKSRALAFQPYFEAGFPHGYDQWISAAGTSWATMALALASPARQPVSALPPLL
jgi:ankyrin repeat protein